MDWNNSAARDRKNRGENFYRKRIETLIERQIFDNSYIVIVLYLLIYTIYIFICRLLNSITLRLVYMGIAIERRRGDSD